MEILIILLIKSILDYLNKMKCLWIEKTNLWDIWMEEHKICLIEIHPMYQYILKKFQEDDRNKLRDIKVEKKQIKLSKNNLKFACNKK